MKSVNLNITNCIMADVRFRSSWRSKMDVRDQFCLNYGSGSKRKKKSSENGKKIEKSKDKHKILKWIPFQKEKWEKKSYGNTQNN